MVILARFQIPVQNSEDSSAKFRFRAQVQDGYVIMHAKRGRCEEIEGGDIRKFTRLMGFNLI